MPARFAKVDENLFRGGRPSKEDLQYLKDKCGVQRVVSLDGDVASDIHNTCSMLEFEHIVIPIDGSYPKENIDKLSNNILDLLGSKKTYVHCYHGKDRSSMACAMYRIASGANVSDALSEAKKFEMGQGLPSEAKKMYYDAVINFSKKDSNSADIVDISRDQSAMDNIAPGLNKHDISSPNQMSFAPFSDSKRDTASPVMNVSASKSLYLLSTPSLVMSAQQWFSRDELIKQLPGKVGQKLYVADIDSRANIIKYPKRYNRVLLQSAKIDGADIVFFIPDVVFVLNSSALINIREEDTGDSNQVGDLPSIGMKGNHDGFSPYVMPASGGFMPPGYGGDGGEGSYGGSSGGIGAAGPVSLPVTEI